MFQGDHLIKSQMYNIAPVLALVKHIIKSIACTFICVQGGGVVGRPVPA